MSSTAFFSRHAPTEAQQATFSALVTAEYEQHGGILGFPPLRPVNVTFAPETVLETIISHTEPTERVIAGVFPGWALLALLRQSFGVVEFVNEPSARVRGVFVCSGAWLHTLTRSTFYPCPVPAAEQEESALAPATPARVGAEW